MLGGAVGRVIVDEHGFPIDSHKQPIEPADQRADIFAPLRVGTTMVSSGAIVDGVRGDVARESGSCSTPTSARAATGSVIAHPSMV